MQMCKSAFTWLIFIIVFSAINSLAQNQRSPIDATSWGVVYDVPTTRQVKLKAEVPYLRDAKGTRTLDLYLPPKLKAGEKRPAVVFLNAFGDRPNDKLKYWEIYRSWPRLVAAHEFVGVSMEAEGNRIQECLRAVFNLEIASRAGTHALVDSLAGARDCGLRVLARCAEDGRSPDQLDGRASQ